MLLHPEIASLIGDMDGPDYITGAYSDINIPSLIILRGVFRVDNSYLGSYLGRTLSSTRWLVEGRDVLDLGCGCGLLGLICSLNGAKSVHFSDINPQAVKNSRLNSLLAEIGNVDFSTGSLFEGLPEGAQFDAIVFNPPSITGVPSNHSEAAFIREDALMTQFYGSFPKYLKDGGQLIMPGSSRFGGDTSPLAMAERLNLKHRVLTRENEADGNYKYVVVFDK